MFTKVLYIILVVHEPEFASEWVARIHGGAEHAHKVAEQAGYKMIEKVS